MRDDFFYTNSLEAFCTSYDVTLRFMYSKLKPGAKPPATGTDPSEALGVPDVMSVTMSPMHLKAMLPALVLLINRYEAQFGKVGLAGESAEAWEKMFKQDGGK